MPHTGQKATVSGIYQNDCHLRRLALSNGDTCPPCPTCHKNCNWTLVERAE